MFDVSREEITEGSLARALVVLAAPLVVQNLVQVVQQTADLFWVGHMADGGAAVAAIGLNFPLVGLLMVPVVGVFVGTQVLVSQRVGGEDLAGGRRAAVHGLGVALLATAALAAAVHLLAPTIVGAVSLWAVSPQVTGLAATYLGVWAFALVPGGMSDALEAGFVAWGDSRAALYINTTAVAVNVAVDPLLIFGVGPFPEWGIAGAAAATVVGYAAGFLLALALAVRGRDGYRLTRDAFRFAPEDVRELVDVGAPSAGQRAASQAVRVVVIALVSYVGGAAGLAAYAIGGRVASVAFIPASGLQQAATSVVGQNIGAGNPLRAARTTWVGAAIAAAALSAFAVVQWLFPTALATLFAPDLAGDALALSVEYLRILAYGYWAIGATYLFLAGFNGASRTDTSMYATLVQYWAVRLPVAVVGALVLDLGVTAVFWAVTVSNVAAALGVGLYYRQATENGMLREAASAADGDAAD